MRRTAAGAALLAAALVVTGAAPAPATPTDPAPLADDVDPADLIHDWGGTALTERGSWLRQGGGPAHPVDLLGAYNAAHDPDLGGDAGWTPTLRAGPPLPTPLVPLAVGAFAGAGRLPL
ncbi:hypothetical protein ABZ744_25185 [Micromonospora chersina]|uniref:hypothetical protein n=1 Tax=Micromonospora chersina TaxID=47854 RepID=UPI0033D771F0